MEPFNDPQEALQYAISYEKGIKRQKSLGIGVAEGSKATIKTEPVYTVDKMNNRECFRCGAANFTTDNINVQQQITNASSATYWDTWRIVAIKSIRREEGK